MLHKSSIEPSIISFKHNFENGILPLQIDVERWANNNVVRYIMFNKLVEDVVIVIVVVVVVVVYH